MKLKKGIDQIYRGKIPHSPERRKPTKGGWNDFTLKGRGTHLWGTPPEIPNGDALVGENGGRCWCLGRGGV